MLDYLLTVLAFVTANIVCAVLAVIVIGNKKFMKWWTKRTIKMLSQMEEMEL